MKAPRAARPGDLPLAMACSLLVFSLAHLMGLTSPYVVNDDVRQQIFWMQRWLDPELFPGDLLSAYAQQYVPWGVASVYRAAALFMNPLYFSKLLPGALFTLLAGCLYLSARRLSGQWAGWFTAVFLWTTPLLLNNLAGGLSRGFAAPLMAWFLCAWLTGRGWGMGLALMAQALFIPYAAPICAGAALLAWAWPRLGGRGAPPPFPARAGHWALLALALALVWLFQHSLSQAGFGPLAGLEQIEGRPEFGPQGRYPILPLPSILWEIISPWEHIGLFRETGLWGGIPSSLLLAGGALAGWRRLGLARLRDLGPLWMLLASSLVLFLLARLLLLKLFLPDRYLGYSLAIAYCLLVGMGWAAWLQARAWRRQTLALLAALAVLLGGLRLHGLALDDYSEGKELYAALAQTPKDCLVAGHPFLTDLTLTFGRRPALATFELAHCWSLGYWQQLEPRLKDMLAAYYAADPQVLAELARRWGACVMVVDRRHFTPEFLAGQPLFAPYDDFIRRTAQGPAFAALADGPFPVREIDRNLRVVYLRPGLDAAAEARR